jgi:hypothetical protein
MSSKRCSCKPTADVDINITVSHTALFVVAQEDAEGIEPGWRLATHEDVGKDLPAAFAALKEHSSYRGVVAALADGWALCGGGHGKMEFVEALLGPGGKPTFKTPLPSTPDARYGFHPAPATCPGCYVPFALFVLAKWI